MISPTMRRRRLGAELRRLREASGMTGEEVGQRLGWYYAKVSKVETGRVTVPWGDVSDLLDVYGVGPGETRERLIGLAREAKRGEGWWQPYNDLLSKNYATLIDLESAATALQIFQPLGVPGLLQTAAYARSIIKLSGPLELDEDVVERRVQLRLDRQAALTKENKAELWVILDEAVLCREVGGPEVMGEQLTALAEAAGRPRTTIQIVPFSAGPHASMTGALGIISFLQPGDPDIAYLDSVAGTMYLERPDEVAAVKISFEHLRATASSPSDSLELILAAARSHR